MRYESLWLGKFSIPKYDKNNTHPCDKAAKTKANKPLLSQGNFFPLN